MSAPPRASVCHRAWVRSSDPCSPPELQRGLVPHREDAPGRIALGCPVDDLGGEDGLGRRAVAAAGLAAVRVEAQDDPGSEVPCHEALVGEASDGPEVCEVGCGAALVVFVVAGCRERLLSPATPGRVVAIREVLGGAIGVGQVAQRQHDSGRLDQLIEQIGGGLVSGRVTTRDVPRREDLDWLPWHGGPKGWVRDGGKRTDRWRSRPRAGHEHQRRRGHESPAASHQAMALTRRSASSME